MLSNQGSANEKVKYLGLRCFAVPVALPQVPSLSNWHVIWSLIIKKIVWRLMQLLIVTP